MMSRIKEVYNYKDMIFSLIKRELRGRYQKSFLGMLWNFLNPLFQIMIYTFVFSYLFDNGIELFYIYLTVGTIPWTFFSESLAQGTGSIVNNSDMTKKIYFPREVLVIASVTGKFVNLILSFSIVFIFLFISGLGVKPELLIWLIPIMLAEYFTALGFTLISSAITVYLRDIEYIVNVLLMAWIWATPIMYALDNIRPELVKILNINPMTRIIMAYHDVLYYQTIPNFISIIAAIIIGIVLLFIGEVVFVKLEGNFAEEL